jgi:purine-binding chemotaxis protein CheW
MVDSSAPTRKARTHTGMAQSVPQVQYLAFDLGGEAFAMEIRFVKEVLQYEELTQVPLMPAFLRGVLNLRGAVLPVIDLSIRFGHPPTAVSRRTGIVVIEAPGGAAAGALGVIVDSVSEVLDLRLSDIEPAPAATRDGRDGFISGLGKLGARFIILLDAHKILSTDELATLTGEVAGKGQEP